MESHQPVHLLQKSKSMKLLINLILAVLSIPACSQQTKEKELKTEIKEVTIFLNRAQVFEAGSAPISSGKTLLTIKGMSPYLEEKSIQVKGEGAFTILSVNHKVNFLNALQRNKRIDSLHQAIVRLEEMTLRDNARLSVLGEKSSLLNANKSLAGRASGISITQLKQAIDLYESEVQKIKDEELSIHSVVEGRNKAKKNIERQLKELNDLAILPTGEIEILVSTKSATTAKFRVTYLVANAGWFPKYDIRVETIRKPLHITYKAEVYQNTGIDWQDVKLRFSNGNPSQSGTVPTLNPWHLGFASYPSAYPASLYGSRAGFDPPLRSVNGHIVDAEGNPIPGVNIIVKGTTLGTVSDASGNYSLALPGNQMPILVVSFIGYQSQEIPVARAETNVVLQPDVSSLSEVAVVGYGTGNPIRIRGAASIRRADKTGSLPIATTTIENQTTVEIEVNEPYSVKSNGEKVLVDLKNMDIDAIYEYYAVPKLDKDAFLIARLINWDQYNLLEGEANLYFEDAFVGRSVLNAKSLNDTLNISLGRDKNIVVGREKNTVYSKSRSFGSNTSETRGFQILVRNKKSQPINITIFDQIPISVMSDITVTPENLSNGVLEKESGKVTWRLNVDAQQQKELKLNYEVKYPKKQKVYLE